MKRRKNRREITAHGETRSITEWADLTGLEYQTISARISRGWTPEEAVDKPSFMTLRGGLGRKGQITSPLDVSRKRRKK